MGQSDDLTGISFSLWRFQRYHLCRHTAHLTRPHLTDEQQMVALLEALRSCPDDVFLSRVQFVGAFEPETVQPGAKPIEVKLIQRFELVVQVSGERLLIGGDEVEERRVALHFDHGAVVGFRRLMVLIMAWSGSAGE